MMTITNAAQVRAALRGPTKEYYSRTGEFLGTGTIYGDLDEAMHAASCLSNGHPDGATVYGTSDPAHAQPDSGEAYQVAIAMTRVDGSTWPVPPAPYAPVYRIIRCPEAA